MCLCNIDNPAEFLNAMREIESEGARPMAHADIICSAQQTADEIYDEALDSKPAEVADKLLALALDEVDAKKRQLFNVAAVMVLSGAHYKERTRQLEKTFGAIQ